MESKRPELQHSEVVNNDLLRSEMMRHLIAAAPDADYEPALGESRPPRVLVQFWDDTESIPGDVRDCLNSWSSLDRAGFDRVLFDDTAARRFIAEHFNRRHTSAFDGCPHPAMRSDYFRYCFMLICGGFYVDADDVYLGGSVDSLVEGRRLKLQPLCYDLEMATMRDVSSSVGTPSGRMIFYANNTPLIAPPGNPVIAGALDRATSNILSEDGGSRDVQSLTGPGNLTAALVHHALDCEKAGIPSEFTLISNWDSIAVSKWPLAYRSDLRNWRLWQHGGA